MNRMYKDMAENFPMIYASQIAAYAEDYANYENGFKPVKMRNTQSRNTVKRSSRRTAAIRNRHKLESQIEFPVIFPQKNQNLILPVRWESEILAYAKSPIGEFMLEFSHKKLLWVASWQDSKTASDKNPFRALAKLLGQKWGEHKYTGIEISLYDMFDSIVFDYGQKPNIRNRTRKIENLPDFRLVF